MNELRSMLFKEWREQYDRGGKKTGMFWGAVVVFPLLGLSAGGASCFLSYQILLDDGPVWIAASLPPVAVLIFAQFGGMVSSNMGLDSIAGERERHTLDTLLSYPVSTRNLFLGKMLLPVIVGIAAAEIPLFIMTVISAILFGPWALVTGGALLVLTPLLVGQGTVGWMAFSMIFSARNESMKVAGQKMAYAMMPFMILFYVFIFVGLDFLEEFSATQIIVSVVTAYVLLTLLMVLFVVIAYRSFQRERLILA